MNDQTRTFPTIDPPTDPDYRPPMDPYLTIIHQDKHLLVLDKQSGLLHVAGKHPSLSDCLEARAREQFPSVSIIHRLDKDTSGVVLMALNKEAHAYVAKQFEFRTSKKSYVARVWGLIKEDSGHIDLPMATDWERRPRQKVDYERGRPSQTDWVVLERETENNITRVRLFPRTGRTHQLRVHMMMMGHPIVGDPFYAEGAALEAADRLQLHAEEVIFKHPETKEECRFHVPCPF
ncbi:MAG: pseudouridine synthase [Micavibrio sp.]